MKISEGEARKAAIEKPAPAYPLVARQLKLTGRAELEAVVGADGQVSDVKVLTGNPIFTKPAVEAVKKWKFKPFQSKGAPATAVVSLSFEFL